jgi:hypothetical protein
MSESGERRRLPDVAIEASVAADEVRHLEVPRVTLRITGTGDAQSDEGGTRQNLPDRVEPGRSYRNVRASRLLAGRLATPPGS